MFTGLHWLESNERDLHGAEKSHNEEGVVRHVDPLGEPTHQQEDEDMEGDEVDDEDVSSPGRDHVEIGQSSPGSPVNWAGLHCLDPEVVGEHEGEDSDALIVVAPRHGPADVAGHDGNEAGSEEPRALRPEFLGQEVGGDRRQSREERSQEDTDVSDVNRDVEEAQHVMNGAGGDHQAGVDSPTYDPAQRVPGSLVKPVEEIIISVLHHVGRCPVVEPGNGSILSRCKSD